MELTQNQTQILRIIRSNARLSLVDIAAKTGFSVSYVYTLFRELRKKAIFKSFCSLDFAKLGYGIKICYVISAKNKMPVEDFLLKSQFVNDIVRINNGNHFFVEAVFKNMAQAYNFSDQLSACPAEICEHHIINELAKEKFMF